MASKHAELLPAFHCSASLQLSIAFAALGGLARQLATMEAGESLLAQAKARNAAAFSDASWPQPRRLVYRPGSWATTSQPASARRDSPESFAEPDPLKALRTDCDSAACWLFGPAGTAGLASDLRESAGREAGQARQSPAAARSPGTQRPLRPPCLSKPQNLAKIGTAGHGALLAACCRPLPLRRQQDQHASPRTPAAGDPAVS
eukprot:scaffold1435_cov267-Pinguiococcus_pyrenoidosus.AAC.56